MRAEVQSNRRTWLLFLLAIAVAGLIATWRIAQRSEAVTREHPPERDDAIELELVDGD